MHSFVILLAAVVAGVTLLAMLGLVLVRRVVPLPLQESHNEVVGHFYAVLSLFTAVLLAFVVVAVWEQYVDARKVAEREAGALGDLFRDAAAFPEAERWEVRDRIQRYASLVESDEWPAMADRRASTPTQQAYTAIWGEYMAIVPRTEREMLWLQRSIEQLDDVADQRRLRLLTSRSALPLPLWITLYALSIATVAFSYLFRAHSLFLHAIETGAIAATLALVLTLLFALQQPFGHLAPLPPDAFRQIVADFESEVH